MINIERGEKIAVSVVDGLKSHPLALGLVVVNVAFIAMSAYTLHELAQSSERRDAQLTALVQDCKVIPPKGDREK